MRMKQSVQQTRKWLSLGGGWLAAIGLVAWVVAPVKAASLVRLSPQGEVAQVGQVRARFDEAMVPFGDAKASAPFTLQCRGLDTAGVVSPPGQPRWIDDKTWVFDFAADLPPGVRCTLAPVPGLKSLAGQAWRGPAHYSFQTGGPAVQSVQPWGASGKQASAQEGSEIEEDQAFILQLNGAVTAVSLQAATWCEATGIQERIPVRVLEGDARKAIIQSQYLQYEVAKAPQRYALVQCQQRLPAGAAMQLVFGPGVATPSGVVNTRTQRFHYRVRQPLTASFSCERENANAPCTPLRPLRLNFSAPVPRKLAQAIVLQTPAGERQPVLDEDDDSSTFSSLRFTAPLPEQAALRIVLKQPVQDDSGRALHNASDFPMAIQTAVYPPLAKFAAAPFGVIERFAEAMPGQPLQKAVALLPVTLRQVDDLTVHGKQIGAQSVAQTRLDAGRSDAEIMRGYAQVQYLHESSWRPAELAAILAGKPPSTAQLNESGEGQTSTRVETRTVSLLARTPGVRQLALPQPQLGKPQPFEVVGIPLPGPGLHVVEIASPKLGAALLGKPAPMYVRTAVLVTNLGVHFKQGRDGALVWVTTLDQGKPVPQAAVQVSDCTGKALVHAQTDAQGIARFTQPLPALPDCWEQGLGSGGISGYFISARIPASHPQAQGQAEMAFALSTWNRGIESWRFHVPTDTSETPNVLAHTVFDRPLLRVGETVSMKHLIRSETAQGFGLPQSFPDKLVLTHLGSGQRYEQPLAWRATAGGGRSAESTWLIPQGAKLGGYEVTLESEAEGRSYTSGQFRVEAFRLPLLEGQIQVQAPPGAMPGSVQAGMAGALVNPKEAPVQLQVNYVSGGGAGSLPVRVSALLRDKTPRFDGYDDFAFLAPSRIEEDNASVETGENGSEGSEEDRETGESQQKLVADKLPLTLDRNGAGRLVLPALPKLVAPKELVIEAGFSDPNGEVQTLRSLATLWPAAVVAGIQAERWASVGSKLRVQALALGLNGKPVPGTALSVRAVAHITTSSRKRVVGGFYAYDNHTEHKDLGTVCSGKSDAQGLLPCDLALPQDGEIELIATARDTAGNSSQASTSVWVTQRDELWFGGQNHDRMDVLPERKTYAPGDTAVFQVRMPFRQATALVTVEREGVLQSQVVTLHGKDPTVRLKIREDWGPNVYISVLAVRGRLRDVPWYSLFTWGWRAPAEWWRAFWYEGRAYQAPSALVDLSRPAFRLGLAEIQVDSAKNRLDVQVKAERDSYPVRGKARVTVQVRQADGKPAAHAEVALAAVDEALLELMPNTSWNLLDALLQRRSYGVETATAQLEIVGRRHYGRKAIPAGGGGGKSPTRELFDTLLLWQPRLTLDAQGRATVDVPLNDSLSRFRIVAVADAGTSQFGTGATTIRSTQDLQILSGLPPLVREGDRFRAQFTLRNTTLRAMTVAVTARVPQLNLPQQTVRLLAGEARELAWEVTAPVLWVRGNAPAAPLSWDVSAVEQGQDAASKEVRDAIRVTQQLAAAVPVTVQQATLLQLDGALRFPVAPPAGAVVGRGGVQLGLQASLAEDLPAVRDWFRAYPYTCLEQKVSRAIGLRDPAQWQAVMSQLPAYLDEDGLANYFPPGEGARPGGSDTLTSYLLVAADEAHRAGIDMALPEAARAQMVRGLIAFIEGRIQRPGGLPTQDLDVRKLAALDALSRSGQAQARMLGSLTLTPNQWPTFAVIDWYSLLQRLPDVPQRAARLQEAEQILRSRLVYQGTRLGFVTEQQDYWWWLMRNGDGDAARLMLAVIDQPGWRDELPRLLTGLLGRQQRGVWQTTTANLWGGLALQRFSARFERTPVSGSTRAQWQNEGSAQVWEWSPRPSAAVSTSASAVPQMTDSGFPVSALPTLSLPWPSAAPSVLQVAHKGSGKPWLTVQSLAAVPLTAPFASGYRIQKTITPIEQAVKGQTTRGDIVRVRLDMDAQTNMRWVVVNDPIPAGATLLGSGLGRDSDIASRGEQRAGAAYLAFEERSFERYRAYYSDVPKGRFSVEYTMRLNNSGDFALPPTRVEAMYAPEVFGELPNARVGVKNSVAK